MRFTNPNIVINPEENPMNKHLSLAVLVVLLGALLFVGCSSNNEDNGTSVPPATPSNLAAQQTLRSQVTLSWSNVADEDTFVVQRSFDSTTWGTIAYTATDVLTAVDPGIHANSKHWYRVASRNIAGTSAYCDPVSIWTWPGVFDFAEDQTDNFTPFSLDGPPDYHVWTWDATNQAGKLGVSGPGSDQFEVSLVCGDTMPNQGWFEFRGKVPAWTGSTHRTEFEYYVEKDPAEARDVVGIKFKSDSTRLVYYTASGITQVATNPTLPLMSPNEWHTVRFFHYQSDRWSVYFDGTRVWDGQIDNVAEGSYGLIQEWQFNRGDDSNNQFVLIDDVANSNPYPTFIQAGIAQPKSDHLPRPVKK
jgi:hypothetical protein